MQDIRFAVRTLRKQPIFTLIAVLTLALGIGANAAIFSLLYQILLRPLPYPDADRLVFVWNTYPGSNLPQASVSIPDYIDRRTQAPALEEATLFTMRTANLNEGGTPEQVRSLAVTPSFFSTLQRSPMIGRAFTEEEAKPDADKFAILAHGLWASHYGSDPSVVGRDIRINGEPYRVVGVLPPDFEIPARDVALLVLQAGVILLLLIACTNVANLLLMRATARLRELAIRTTLGAGRRRIIAQLLTEGIVLSLAGAAAGLAVGVGGVKALIALSTTQIPGSPEATLHVPVLLFTLTLAFVTGIVFGLVPAVTVLRGNTAAFLKDDSSRGTPGKRTGSTRTMLVVAETAIAVVLLIGAGLMIKSFARLQSVDPGFTTDNGFTAQVALPPAGS